MPDLISTDPRYERLKTKAARLERFGLSSHDIAKALRVDAGEVHAMLKEISLAYRDYVLTEHKEELAHKLEQYRELRREAFAAWLRSRKPGKAREKLRAPVAIRGEEGEGEGHGQGQSHRTRLRVVRDTLKISSRDGDMRCLNLIKECLDMECKLLGLLQPEGLRVNLVNLNWEVFTRREESPDLIEAEIRKVELLESRTSGPYERDEDDPEGTEVEEEDEEDRRFRQSSEGRHSRAANGQAHKSRNSTPQDEDWVPEKPWTKHPATSGRDDRKKKTRK